MNDLNAHPLDSAMKHFIKVNGLINLIKRNVCAYPVQNGRRTGPKRPPIGFSPVASTNVGISPQNFLAISFNPFATLL